MKKTGLNLAINCPVPIPINVEDAKLVMTSKLDQSFKIMIVGKNDNRKCNMW